MATLTTRHGRRRQEPQPPKQVTPVEDAPATGTTAAATATPVYLEPERRHAMICEAAYFRAERRDFCPGHELEDWFAAEGDIERALAAGEAATPRGA